MPRGGAVFSYLISARRQFNLPRWTRRRAFRDLHATAEAWLDRHFELIEAGAPWLRPAGRQVRDSCSGLVRGLDLSLTPQFKAQVGCKRTVTAIYGFDDPLIERVRTLDQAIPTAGWEMTGRQAWQDFDPRTAATATGMDEFRTRWMTDRQVGLTWKPTEALGLPAGQERMSRPGSPPFAPHMRVSWSSRGQPSGWRSDPIPTGSANRNYLPIEVAGADIIELLEQARARYEHVLVIRIELSYFSRQNLSARQIPVPRHLLPTRAGPAAVGDRG